MINPHTKKIVFEIAKITIWNRADRKAFRWLFYLATVATNHTWTEDEKRTLRQLRRKYAPYKPRIVNKTTPTIIIYISPEDENC